MSSDKYALVKAHFHPEDYTLFKRIIAQNILRNASGRVGYEFQIATRDYLRTFFPRLERKLEKLVLTHPFEYRTKYVHDSLVNLQRALNDDYDIEREVANFEPQYAKADIKQRQREKRAEEASEMREKALPRAQEDYNPITWRWDPETVTLRQIDWLMKRKRRIFQEKRIGEFMFNYEMKHLAQLRKRELDKQKASGRKAMY